MKQIRNTKQKYGFRKVKYVAGLASAVLASLSINASKPQTIHADTNTNNLQDNRATGEKSAEEELDHIPNNPNSKTQTPSQKQTVHIIDDSTQQNLKHEKPVKNTPNVNKSVPNKDVETPKTTDKDYIPDNPKDSPNKTVSHVDNTVDNNTVQIADKDYILDNPKNSPTKTVSHVDNNAVNNNAVNNKTVSHVNNNTVQTADISTAALDLTKKQIAAKSAKMAKLSNNLSLYNTSLFASNDVNTTNPNTVFPNLTKDNWQDPASWGLQKTNVGWTYSIPQYVADSSQSYFMDGNGNKQEGTHVIGLKDEPATSRTHINAEINPNTANASTNSDVLVASMPILINDPMAGMPGHATLPPTFAFHFLMNNSVYDKHGNYIGYLWYNAEKNNDMKIYWHNTGKNYSDNVNINFDFDSAWGDKGFPDAYNTMAKTGKEFDIEFVSPDGTFSNWREVYNSTEDDHPYIDNIDNINVQIGTPSVYWYTGYLSINQDQSLDKTDIHTELYHKVEQNYAYDKQGNIVKITSVYSPHFITSSKATDGTQTLAGFRYDLYNIPLKRLADNLTSQQVYDQTPAHSMSYSLQTDGSILTGYNVSPSDAKYNEDQVRDTVDSLYYTNYQHPEDKQKWITATIDAMKKRNWVAPVVNSLESFLSWDTNRVVTATSLDVTPNVKANIQKDTSTMNTGDADAAYLQTATLNFIDDDDHDKVISHQLIMGPQDKTKQFRTNVPNDYVLTNPNQIVISHHFTYNDKSIIDIHVKHKIIGTVDDLKENAHNDRDYLINQIKSHQVKDLIDGVQDQTHVTKDNFLDYFSLNGSATYDQNTGIVTLTPDDNVKVGNFAFKRKLDMNTSFTLTGKVNLGSDPNGADGFGFAFHNGNVTDIGGAGDNLGIGGLQNALGFKLDTYQNEGEPMAPYGTFVDTDNKGNMQDIAGADQALSKSDLNGQFHDFTVNYDGNTKKLTIKYTQTSGKILTWTMIVPKSSPARAMAVSAATWGAKNLQQFQIMSFDIQDDSNKDLDQLSSNISIVQDPDQTYTANYNDESDINNKLSQINNDYIQQQNDILNQLKDWSNKAKAYNAKRNDFINKLKQEGLWTKGMDPKDFKQNLHIGNEETATVAAEVLKNSGTVDDHGSHEGNLGYTFNSSQGADLSGDFLKLTYSNLKDSTYNGEAISKIVVTYHDVKDGSSYSVFFKNNPIYGWNPGGGDAAARIEFYDANGNLIHMHSAYLTVGSFNTWANGEWDEAAILQSGGTPLQIPESSVTNHTGNLIYADKDNSSSVLFYYNNPNWDKDPNRVAQDQAYADTHYPQVWSHEIEKRYQGWDSSPTAPNRIFGAILIKLDEGSSGIDIRPVAYDRNNGKISGIGNWFNWSTTIPQLSFDAQAPKLELHYHNDNLHLTKTSTYQVIEKMPHPIIDPNKYGSDQVILKTIITAGKDIARDMVTGATKQTKFLGKYTSGTVDKGHTDGVDQTVISGNVVGLPGYELDPFYAETKEQYDDPNNPTSHGAVLSVSDSNNTIHFNYLVGKNYQDANGIEMSDLPDDQTWYVTMHPLAQHANIVYVDNDTNETVKTTPLQGVTDEQINLIYEAPANYTIAPNQDLPSNYLFTASDNSDIDVWLNHATQPTTQTHTAKRIFKLQFNGQDIKHDYVQTGTITITGNQDLLTGDSNNGNYSLAQWNEITKDDLTKLYQQYGYQTNGHDLTLDGNKFTTINTVEIDPDTQDETHIINVVPTKRPINYIDIATNNTVASDSVQGVTNAVIQYAPNVPYGYELVTPQASYNIPILGDNTPFDIYVKSSTIHIDHTNPHHKGELIYDDNQPNMVYPNNVDYDDLNQTITRTINVYEPNGVITQIVQKVVLYRDADYDLVHHTTTYTPWQANGPSSWDSYTAPDFDGYTPDLSHINATTPLPNSQDVTSNIHYKETGSEVLLAYNDTDESGTEFARYNEGGNPNSTIQIDWLNHMTQDMPGYEIVPGQVINGQHLDDLLKNHAALTYTLSDVNKPIVINIRHITSDVTNTDLKAKSSSERTLTIIEPNGHTIVYTQHVNFIRTATLDHATGLVSYGNWHVSGGYESDTNGGYKAIPANNQSTYTVDSINIPAFANYETRSDIIDNNGNTLTNPNTDNILPSITVSPDSPTRNYLVTYHKMNYDYFGDNNKQHVDSSHSGDGSTNSQISNSNKVDSNFVKNAINLPNYTPEALNKQIGNVINTDLSSVTKNSIKDVYHYVPHFTPTTVKLYTYVPHFAPTVIKAYQSIPTFGTKLRKANTLNPALLGFKPSNIPVQKPHNLATLGLMTTMLSLLSK